MSWPFALGKIELNRHFAVFLSVLVLALAVLSIFTSWLAPTKPDKDAYEATPDRSVFNAKPSGYQYWYQTVQILQNSNQLPNSILLWRDNFTMIAKLPGTSTMVLVEPSYSAAGGLSPAGNGSSNFSTREMTQLLTWVGQGNTLIYLDQLGRPHTQVLMERLGLHKIKNKPPAKPKPFTVRKAAPKPMSALEKSLLPMEEQERIRQLELSQKLKGLPPGITIETWEEQPVVFTDTTTVLKSYLTNSAFIKPVDGWGTALEQFKPVSGNASEVLLKTSQTPVLMKVPYGEGEVWIGSVPELAQNSYLKQKTWDNYQLFTNLILSPGKPVYINEFIHGQATSSNSLFGYYYLKTPLGRMGVQLFITFLFLLWWSFSNWRPKRTPILEADAPISLQAFVNSLSGLYQKAEAAPLVLKPYWRLVSQQIEKRCRINILPSRSPDEMEHLLDRHLGGSSGLLKILGYSDGQSQETIDHLSQVYQVLDKAQSGKSSKYCTEKELKDWVKTMATLLNAMESRYRHPALK